MFQKQQDKTIKRRDFILDEKKSNFTLIESFRGLMTNIGFSIPKKEDGKGKVVCISSAVSGEGKSTVAVNLAVTCAHSGARTVIVDCDTRKPRIKKFFKLDSPGIVPYLSGEETLENVIAQNVMPNLDVIICRHPAPNPITLLTAPSFDEMLERLVWNYDYVIIDTPPVGLVSDAVIIAQKTDGVVLVTRQMYSNHRVLKEVVQSLEFANCRILGFVLNDFCFTGKSYYSGRYRYNYKYKYGYSDYKSRFSSPNN